MGAIMINQLFSDGDNQHEDVSESVLAIQEEWKKNAQNKELMAEKEKNKELEKRIKELETVCKKLETGREEYKSKYFQFKSIFQKQTHTFYLFQSLSKSSLDALSGIFKGSSFEGFLACGVQPGNIDALWEFTRTEALQGNEKDVEILVQIILYFVNLYNGTNTSPVLAIQPVKEGDSFDVDEHIRTQTSKAAGTISKVLLPGLTNAFTGDVIKKAVVEIAE